MGVISFSTLPKKTLFSSPLLIEFDDRVKYLRLTGWYFYSICFFESSKNLLTFVYMIPNTLTMSSAVEVGTFSCLSLSNLLLEISHVYGNKYSVKQTLFYQCKLKHIVYIWITFLTNLIFEYRKIGAHFWHFYIVLNILIHFKHRLPQKIEMYFRNYLQN